MGSEWGEGGDYELVTGVKVGGCCDGVVSGL